MSAAHDFVHVVDFDPRRWAASYRSDEAGVRPTSDTPLLHACLDPGACAKYGWTAAPRVALHGHALATGAGNEATKTKAG